MIFFWLAFQHAEFEKLYASKTFSDRDAYEDGKKCMHVAEVLYYLIGVQESENGPFRTANHAAQHKTHVH